MFEVIVDTYVPGTGLDALLLSDGAVWPYSKDGECYTQSKAATSQAVTVA